MRKGAYGKTKKLKIMHKIKALFPQYLKNIYHLSLAIIANLVFGFPSKNLKVIGVTGTDGKTTTVQMITKILEDAGKKVAMASTINFRINGKEEKNLSHFTTTSAFALQKFLKHAADEKCEYLVLETSSHALDQFRAWGISFQIGVITNITREHLDYHVTMEKYRRAKQKLFENVSQNNGTLIVNLEMEKPEDFLKYDGEKKYGYTTNSHQSSVISHQQNFEIVRAENIKLAISGSQFEIKNSPFKLQLQGLFNVENALAAACVGINEQIGMEEISRSLGQIKGVPGRMETIENDKKLHILVNLP